MTHKTDGLSQAQGEGLCFREGDDKSSKAPGKPNPSIIYGKANMGLTSMETVRGRQRPEEEPGPASWGG